jgi:hypothetical protein
MTDFADPAKKYCKKLAKNELPFAAAREQRGKRRGIRPSPYRRHAPVAVSLQGAGGKLCGLSFFVFS